MCLMVYDFDHGVDGSMPRVGPEVFRFREGMVRMEGALNIGTENSLCSSAMGWIEEDGRRAEEVWRVSDGRITGKDGFMSSILRNLIRFSLSLDGFLLCMGRARFVPFSSTIYRQRSAMPPG